MSYRPPVLSPRNLEDFVVLVQNELDQLARVLQENPLGGLVPQGVEPKKFQEGSVAMFAEGVTVTGIASTTAGLHQFRAGAWRRLAEV